MIDPTRGVFKGMPNFARLEQQIRIFAEADPEFIRQTREQFEHTKSQVLLGKFRDKKYLEKWASEVLSAIRYANRQKGMFSARRLRSRNRKLN